MSDVREELRTNLMLGVNKDLTQGLKKARIKVLEGCEKQIDPEYLFSYFVQWWHDKDISSKDLVPQLMASISILNKGAKQILFFNPPSKNPCWYMYVNANGIRYMYIEANTFGGQALAALDFSYALFNKNGKIIKPPGPPAWIWDNMKLDLDEEED